MNNTTLSRKNCILLAGITVLGFAIRWLYLGDHALWWDEIATATRATLSLPDLWASLMYQGPSPVGTDLAPPLHHIAGHFGIKIFGKSDFGINFFSLICGTLTIPVVFFIGRELLNIRVGFFASAILSLNYIHIYYSRNARWYSMFHFFAALSLLLFIRALKTNSFGSWGGFVLATTGMFYTSYVSISYIAGLCCALGCLVLINKTFCSSKKSLIINFLASLICIAVLFSPWFTGQLNAFNVHYTPMQRTFQMAGLLASVRLYCAPFFYPEWVASTLVIFMFVAGIFAFYTANKTTELIILLFWATIPVVIACNSPINTPILPRFTLSLLFLLVLLGAASADIASNFISKMHATNTLFWQSTYGSILVAIYMSLTFVHYPTKIMEDINTFKPLMSWLVREKYSSDYLMFEASRHMKAITDWYLPDGHYKTIADFKDRKYKRCVFVGGNPPAASTRQGVALFKDTKATRVGIVNRAPLFLELSEGNVFTYDDNFTDLRAYSDAVEIDNVAVSTSDNDLALYDLTKPGSIKYTFVNSLKNTPTSVTLKLQVNIFNSALLSSDAKLTIQTDDADGNIQTLRTLSETDFVRNEPILYIQIPLDEKIFSKGNFSVQLSFVNGIRHGIINVKRFTVEAIYPENTAFRDTSVLYAENIANNTSPAKFEENNENSTTTGDLYVFKLSSSVDVLARERLRLKQPGIEPVYTILSGKRSIFEYYDPKLFTPFLPLRSGTITNVHGWPSSDDSSYVLKGMIDFPLIHNGELDTPLMLKAPYGSTVSIVPKATGRLTLRPNFQDESFNPLEFSSFSNVRKLQGQPVITCAKDEPCSATYLFQSIFPVTSLRIVWYPRIFCDTKKKNYVYVSIKDQEHNSRILRKFVSTGTGSWTGPDRLVESVTFDRPVNIFEVSFHLAGDGTLLWSDENLNLTIDAAIDTRSAPPLTNFLGALTVDPKSFSDFGLLPMPNGTKFYDNLEYKHDSP